MYNNQGKGRSVGLNEKRPAKASTLTGTLPFNESTSLQGVHSHSTTKTKTNVFRSVKYFGGEVSGFMLRGGRESGGDLGRVLAKATANGEIKHAKDVHPFTLLPCWHCQKDWLDIAEEWLTWTDGSGASLGYSVCFPCVKEYVESDLISKAVFEVICEENLTTYILGREVANGHFR